MMFNLGPFELVAIFVVALLVFGPDKLPEIGRQVGKGYKEFRKFQSSLQDNVREVLEPISGPLTGSEPQFLRQDTWASSAVENLAAAPPAAETPAPGPEPAAASEPPAPAETHSASAATPPAAQAAPDPPVAPPEP